MDIAAFFDTAVLALNRNKSAELGNRKLYIGSSDVGSCARKVYLQRKTPKTPNVSTLLKFSRGHIAETLIENIFVAGGVKDLFDTQVEVRHPQYPLKAHIDFLFYADLDGSHELHVVEVKSVSSIPDEPYPQWIDQLHFQLGLLRIQYPQGKIGGSVLAIDLNAGEIHQFNGYEYDDATFNYLVNKALHLIDCLEERDEARPSVSRNCSFCPYRSDCPAMSLPKVELPPEIETMAMKYAELNSTKRLAEREMKGIRQELLEFTGPVFKGRSDTVDLIASFVDPSLIVDGDRLRLMYPDIYDAVLKERAGYVKLECKQAPPATS
ncbi:MAG: PD-(D/E)XK nuclease family protein [Deltaproteobacteria bacterium]|nr:PD-(D/E)XK nuclease family protein [Deltaproteobacteria bacterium]